MHTPVAIKKYKNSNDQAFKAFLTEIDILQSLKSGHPNIIQFLGGFKQGPYSYLVFELAKGGNLQSFIKCKKNRSPS